MVACEAATSRYAQERGRRSRSARRAVRSGTCAQSRRRIVQVHGALLGQAPERMVHVHRALLGAEGGLKYQKPSNGFDILK